ncbi:sensor histidine kinase [Actinoplanes sp. CA-015351]|uniref:sensor histidine kinase n=1 Tax=Actinoplanes sp. CA-015351 TaxID=3239897 RepID=UPI003D96C20E
MSAVLSAALLFVVAGVVAWWVRPGNRTGPLLVAAGLLWMVSRSPVPVGGWWAAVLAHLVLAFPSGRLIGAGPRAAAVLAYLSAAVYALVQAVASQNPAPQNVAPDVAAGAGVVGAVLTGVAVAVVQVGRWRRGTVAQRRLLAPVTVAGLFATTLFVAGKPALIAGAPVPYLTDLMPLAFATIPVAVLAGMLRDRFDRAGVANLVVQLNTPAGAGGIQRALAGTLHDPGLRVAYRVPGTDRYVGADGEDAGWDTEDVAVTRIDRGDENLAVLIHDRALLENPALIDAACAAAALALDNERLTADLRARLRDLAASRARILRSAEDERRRLERDLHDGVQQRLLSIPLTLALAESVLADRPDEARPLLADARRTALAVLDELRAIGQGIHPPILTERGLEAAVRELAALAPLPVTIHAAITEPPPEPVETTAYFVIAEALANMTKHARARHGEIRIRTEAGTLRVEVSDDGRGGAGLLSGITDRVRNNGGTVTIASPVGGGTRVQAVLPCA